MGWLAMVSPNFVAPDLGRFLLGDLQAMRAVIEHIIDNMCSPRSKSLSLNIE
jgi:hypothetical protein